MVERREELLEKRYIFRGLEVLRLRKSWLVHKRVGSGRNNIALDHEVNAFIDAWQAISDVMTCMRWLNDARSYLQVPTYMTYDSVTASTPVTTTTLVSNYPIPISVARKMKEKQRPRCKPPVIDILYRLSLIGAII